MPKPESDEKSVSAGKLFQNWLHVQWRMNVWRPKSHRHK